MNCMLCKKPGVTLCGACALKLAEAIPRAVKPQDERFYWEVTHNKFVAIIDRRDASTEEEAQREALNPLTRWYFVGAAVENQDLRVRRITHDQFVDWLREGHSFALPSLSHK